MRCCAHVVFWLSSLFLLAAAVPNDSLPPAASFFVPSIPDIVQDPNHPLTIFAGNLPADPKASRASETDVINQLYFVMVKNRRTADRERVIFWFNGGPGCSSFDGLMMEVGPWRWDHKHGFKVQEGGWEEYTTMIYVDQPAGTGFSVASTNNYVHSLQEASDQFVEFLGNFYKVFPEFRRMDTYFGGESYAGQYIPYFATAVLNSRLETPLKGVAIGNGWIDAYNQNPSFIEFAVKLGFLEENSKDWKAAKAASDECNKYMSDLKSPVVPINVNGPCQAVLLKVFEKAHKKVDGVEKCINIYDVRYTDTYPACGLNWPEDIHPITTFLDRPEVVQALHATENKKPWKECRHQVHVAVDEKKSNSSITLLPKLLEKIPILIFAGDQDIICNYIGMEAMIKAMSWNGATGLGKVKTENWMVNGSAAGTWVSSRNLTYTKIFNASHMAPYDAPHASHDMMLRFMGFNFSAVVDGSALIPSSIGDNHKPLFISGGAINGKSNMPAAKTPQQNKAMWEAYYNAGSAAIVLLFAVAAIGTFIWCRYRRTGKAGVQLPLHRGVGDDQDEENIPLNRRDGDDDDDSSAFRQRSKGKGRAVESLEPPIFDVGDGDSDDEAGTGTGRYNDGPGLRIH